MGSVGAAWSTWGGCSYGCVGMKSLLQLREWSGRERDRDRERQRERERWREQRESESEQVRE